jgi:hypothetical protein
METNCKYEGVANMKTDSTVKYSVRLAFEEIKLPPFEEILILGKKCPQGKIGVHKSFEFLVPNEYESFEIESDTVEAIFINKRLLKKINKESIVNILEEKVFPYVSDCEILKVDFKLKVIYDTFELEESK